jgi:hypothetical protein
MKQKNICSLHHAEHGELGARHALRGSQVTVTAIHEKLFSQTFGGLVPLVYQVL